MWKLSRLPYPVITSMIILANIFGLHKPSYFLIDFIIFLVNYFLNWLYSHKVQNQISKYSKGYMCKN